MMGPLISIQGLSMQEFIDALAAQICKQLEPTIKKAIKEQQEERLLNSSEVCKLLSVSKPTLNAWSKEGKVTVHRIGKRVYFKHSEIFASLQTLKKYKPKSAA